MQTRNHKKTRKLLQREAYYWKCFNLALMCSYNDSPKKKSSSPNQQSYLSSLTQHPAKPIEVFVGCVQFLELSVTSIKNCEQ